MATVSFAKVAGAGSSAPVQPTPTAETEVVPPEAETTSPQNLPVVQPPASPVPSSGFYSGEEDDLPVDRGDVRLPRLNIVQGLSEPELKKIGPDGTLVLKRTLAIPQPARIVVCGVSRKRYAEKMPKYGEGESRIFDTLEEVIKAGGTDQWKFSRECKDKEGIPLSRKPWFQPMVTALLLIEKPANLAPEFEEHFGSIAPDGTAFAACVFTAKSTSYGAFYVPLISEKTAGVLRHGFYTHWISLTTHQPTKKHFEPLIRIGEPTSEVIRAHARAVVK